MTLNEFKAWLEGYKESFDDGQPNKDQFEEIERRLGEVVPNTKEPYIPRNPYNPQKEWGYWFDEWKRRRTTPTLDKHTTDNTLM